MGRIHPTAVVDPGARVDGSVAIGPFCVVGPEVSLAEGVVLHSHVVVTGRTTVGSRTEIFPFASIGHRPQDLKFRGEDSELIIGAGNVIREHVTMNPGTEGGGMATRVGDRGLFMMGSHVAHDCQIGNNVIMANNATLAGHVVVGDNVIIGGLSAVLQFVRIGRNAMIGGMSGVEQDVIPFGLVMGERATLSGLNLVGLKRSDTPREEIQKLQEAFRSLFRSEGTMAERLEEVERSCGAVPAIDELVAFIRADSAHGICQPKRRNGG
jgi:UDP-N-acetylglucosamine acyltransferase